MRRLGPRHALSLGLVATSIYYDAGEAEMRTALQHGITARSLTAAFGLSRALDGDGGEAAAATRVTGRRIFMSENTARSITSPGSRCTRRR